MATRLATAPVGAGTPTGRRYRAKLAVATQELLAHPGASVRAASSVGRSHQGGTAAILHRLVAWQVAQGLTTAARTDEVDTLLDEGSLQALWSLGLVGDHRGLLTAWRSRPTSWAVSDVVVVLQPPLATLDRRLTGRADPHSRVERLDGPRRRDALVLGDAVLHEIVASLPDLGIARGAVVTLADAAWGPSEVGAVADRIAGTTGAGIPVHVSAVQETSTVQEARA